jgi:hypothetical protein
MTCLMPEAKARAFGHTIARDPGRWMTYPIFSRGAPFGRYDKLRGQIDSMNSLTLSSLPTGS